MRRAHLVKRQLPVDFVPAQAFGGQFKANLRPRRVLHALINFLYAFRNLFVDLVAHRRNITTQETECRDPNRGHKGAEHSDGSESQNVRNDVGIEKRVEQAEQQRVAEQREERNCGEAGVQRAVRRKKPLGAVHCANRRKISRTET